MTEPAKSDANPYEAVEITQDTSELEPPVAPLSRWANRLFLTGFTIGFGLGVVIGVQVMRLVIQDGDATIAWAVGYGLYAALLMTLIVGLPLGIAGWIVGSLLDMGTKPSERI